MRLKKIQTINVIPFIDIMLVLLVIVLTTATFMNQKALQVNLPKSTQGDQKLPQKALVISIDKEGQFLLDNSVMPLDAIAQRVREVGPDHPIELHADQTAQYKDFIGLLQLLKRLNHTNLYIVTQR
ncbi:MAG: hypothetical protein KU37_04780 [Sulfuricurvum sp. PC08-66]|nr:MAG: hypothetical protein KU37_04780 [Sulfuricurvum sp. PC08-66]